MAEFESCSKCKFDGKSTHDFPCNECVHNAREHFRPKSNADKIRAMSDEELAEWITKVTNDAQRDARTKCDYQWGEWLKSEAKEET